MEKRALYPPLAEYSRMNSSSEMTRQMQARLSTLWIFAVLN